MKYKVKLKDKREVAAGTMAFYFEKPEGFTYRLGQHADWNEMDPSETDEEGAGRCFTLASAPFEESLMIATRMRGTAFKRVLSKMEPGATIELDGPRGMLTLSGNITRPVVFLAGGIGVTPFRSMVLAATHDHDPRKIYLFCSNRHPEDGPFMEEFYRAERENPNFKFIPTVTKPDEVSGWKGETGHISAEMIKRYAGDGELPIYYLAGPSEMTNALNETLINMGVPVDNIKVDRKSVV